MSDKTYVFNSDGGASSGLMNTIAPLLQQRGIDPAYLMGMMNNGGFGGFGNGWNDIIALIVVAAIFGNGNFGFGNNGNNANNAEREMLMSAIQRNGTDLSQLAQSIGCSTGRLQDAIGQVTTQICNLAGQQGLSFQQVINSIQAGNCALTNQLASCCCDIKQAIGNVNVGMERGFSSVAYETQRQTCDIEKAIAGSTASITARLDAMEKANLYDKLDALREKNSVLTTQLNLEHQNQFTANAIAQAVTPLNGAVAHLQSDVDGIKCKLPKTETIIAQPDYVPVQRSINIGYAPYCYGANYGCGYGYGYGNGTNNLWG